MKKLFFLLILFFGLIESNNMYAQKNSNCTPSIPKDENNWTIDYNFPGEINVDFSKIKLVPLKEGLNFSGNFKEEAANGLSACYLDFLLNHQDLIPADWQKNVVVFTGTVFKEDGKYLVYRTMFYNKDQKIWLPGKNYLEYMLEKSYRITLSFLTTRYGGLFSITKNQISSIMRP